MPKVRALSADYAKENLCGWAGEDIAKQEYARMNLDETLPKFRISGATGDYHGQKRMLYEINRKVLGKDTPNYPQEIGDCTSFGGKNAMEYLQCSAILLGENYAFHAIYPPYIYGAERVWVGGGQIWGDGGTGVWVQEAVKKYGVLASDQAECPPYSGSVAKSWGKNGPPAKFKSPAGEHLVKASALCTSAEDAANAILNGYPVAICSNQGFSMGAGSDGFMRAQGTWSHCMCLIGFQDHPTKGLYFIILNNWGDVHGQLKDFDEGTNLPVGCIRAHGNVVDSMLKLQDSFIYSNLDGFPGQADLLDKSLFDLLGD